MHLSDLVQKQRQFHCDGQKHAEQVVPLLNMLRRIEDAMGDIGDQSNAERHPVRTAKPIVQPSIRFRGEAREKMDHLLFNWAKGCPSHRRG